VYAFLISPVHATFLMYLIILLFIMLVIFGEEYK
jgi:hypothetical protein